MKTMEHRIDPQLTEENQFRISDPDLLFDRRLIARHIAAGHTTRDEYKKHLDALGDCAELGDYPEEEVSESESDEATSETEEPTEADIEEDGAADSL